MVRDNPDRAGIVHQDCVEVFGFNCGSATKIEFQTSKAIGVEQLRRDVDVTQQACSTFGSRPGIATSSIPLSDPDARCDVRVKSKKMPCGLVPTLF